MSKRISKILASSLTLSLLCYVFLFVANYAFAQVGELPDLPDSPTDQFTRSGLITQIVSGIIPIVLGIAGFVTAIIIVLSGIQFITSSGNPEGAGAAKNRLVYAIIGFVVIILAFAALQIINAVFLGTNVI